MKLGVAIPACNEEFTIADVVARCLEAGRRLGETRVVVADNDSGDGTEAAARAAGAEVVFARPRGYGRACQAAVEHLADWPDLLLFIDADGSSRPEELPLLLAPLLEGRADLVLGRRPAGSPMTWPQRWGTRLATGLIRLRWRHAFQDLGPFRAMRLSSYRELGLRDKTWGWTVEMQILALKRQLEVVEVPVSWLPRQGGVSKISGTVSGVVRAGVRILWTIGRHAL